MTQWCENPNALWALLLGGALCAALRIALTRRRAHRGEVLRSAVLGFAVTGVLGVVLSRPRGRFPVHRKLCVMFAIDTSASMQHLREEAEQFLRGAAERDHGDASVGLVLFDDKVRVQARPGEGLPTQGALPQSFEGRTTDLAAAIRRAVDIAPPDAELRLVLVTDGRENVGDSRTAAELCRRTGARLYAVRLKSEGHEMAVANLICPSVKETGAVFDLKIGTVSTRTCPATLRVTRGRDLVEARRVTLPQGMSLFAVRDRVTRPGIYEYVAEVSAPGWDTNPGNNSLRRYVTVVGQPKVLVVDDSAAAGATLRQALTLKGIAVDHVTPQKVPTGEWALDSYDAVVLNSFNRFALGDATQNKMQSIERAVRDFGVGLILVAGRDGLNTFNETPIERCLPVEVGRLPSVVPNAPALVLVIDKSISMKGKKLALAKEAAIRTVRKLPEDSLLGIVVFHFQTHVVQHLRPIRSQREAVIEKIRQIGVSSGTNMYPALVKARSMFGGVSEELNRHVIVITDGVSRPGPFIRASHSIAEQKITISTIAVGTTHTDPKLLKRIAEIGKGKFYEAKEDAKIPRMVIEDVSSKFLTDDVKRRGFKPLVLEASPMLEGIEDGRLPMLTSYSPTTPKPAANVPVIVRVERGSAPILAYWRYGIGKSVVFASDVESHLSQGFVKWQGFPRFWSQTLRWCLRPGQRQFQLRVQYLRESGQVLIRVRPMVAVSEVQRVDVEFESGPSELKATLNRVAPNTFEHRVRVAAGRLGETCVVRVWGRRADGSAALFRARKAAISGLPGELSSWEPDTDLLKELCARTNGRTNPTLDEVFAPGRGLTVTRTLPAHYGLIALLIVFLIDIWIRV